MRPVGEEPKERLFTFWSGGWVLLLAGLVGLFVTWRVFANYSHTRERAFGDGKDVATYRFDMEPCLVDRATLVASGMPRNGARAMNEPEVMTGYLMEGSPSRKLRTLLVPSDRVVGVEFGGEARAYPLRILNWHEVVNDTLGGRKIAVTYNPLCDSVAVFDREIDGKAVEFRVSGLLWNSSQLLFIDAQEVGGESLWSQLLAKAVTGPDAAAGRTLEVLPMCVVPWGDWKAKHPDTTVISPDPSFVKQYPRNPYISYYGTRSLRFPVSPYPPPGEGDGWNDSLAILAPDGVRLIENYDGKPPATGDAGVIHAFRWAWYATRGN